MKQLSMLSFNSLRQRAPELLAVAIPLGLAVAIQALWILVGSRAAADPKGSASPDGGDSTVVDNTAQLVRITRRAAQQQTLASVGLDLSGTLPSPLGDEETVDLPEAPLPECPPASGTEELVQSDQPSPAKSSSRANPTQRQPLSALTPTREDPALLAAEELTTPAAIEINATSIMGFWRQAMGVPVWPKEIGPRRDDVELRELSLKDFQGREAKQLHNLEVTTQTATYQLKVLGDRVLLLKTSSTP